MSNQILMFAGGAMALVVVATLVVAFFTMTRRRAIAQAAPPVVDEEATRPGDARAPLPLLAAQSGIVAGEGALVHMVVNAQEFFQPQEPHDELYELDVVRVRLPNLGFDGVLGGKDAMSVVLKTQYFDMLRKMGASSSAPAR